MDLTIDDRARLMPLLRSAIAEQRKVLWRLGPGRVEGLEDSLEWGEDMLRRLETLDEVQR